MTKSIGVFLVLLLFSGCTSPVPPAHEYRLDVEALQIKTKESKCTTASLKVQNAYCDDIFMSRSMYYIEGKYNQYAYSEAKWAQTPQTMITNALTQSIRAMDMFQSVQSSDSKTKNDFLLEITIDDFMQYFDENGKNSFVKVTLTCTVVDMKTHKVYSMQTFQKEMKTKSNDALGGVEALSSALSALTKECDEWLKGVVCHDK